MKIFRDLMEETHITLFSHIVFAVHLALVQHSSCVELKSITFSRLRDQKVLPSAGLEQLSRGVALMVQTCRSRELFALPHNAKTRRLNPNPAPCVSSICSFDIWLVYSMNMSLPHRGIETPWSLTSDARDRVVYTFSTEVGKKFYLVWNFFKGLTLLIFLVIR